MFCPDCGETNKDSAPTCRQCGAPLPWRPLARGARLERGRYEILQPLKSGAMGALYLVNDRKFDRSCAMKEMLEGTSQPGYREMRFHEEARLLANLHHPQLPIVYDYFRESDINYIVMQYVEGEDLESVVKRRGAPGLPEETVLDWSLQLLAILEYLHGQSPPVVHRDIKPSNIILRHTDLKVVLVDFGIARAPLTGSSGTAVGTVGYAPLEQYQGKAEPRSDLYALGATMLHLLTGLPPIPFHTPALDTVAPHVSPGTRTTIQRALCESLDGRFPSAVAMREAISAPVPRVKIRPARAVDGAVIEKVRRTSSDTTSMIFVPEGAFLMGSDADDVEERPLHEVRVPAFYLDPHPVTFSRFAVFVEDTGYVTEAERGRSRFNWRRPRVWLEEMDRMGDHPVVYITYHDALAYCRWAGKRLPTEAEWEKAARGNDGRRHPWGERWEPRACNWGDGGLKDGYRGTSPVDGCPKGASPYGALDMVGNVWEWTSSRFRPYPYRADDGREEPEGAEQRVLRGSSYNMAFAECMRATIRLREEPGHWRFDFGFRCAADGKR